MYIFSGAIIIATPFSSSCLATGVTGHERKISYEWSRSRFLTPRKVSIDMFRKLPTFKSLPQAIGLPFLSTTEDAQLKFKSGDNGVKRLAGDEVG